jgi:hypothetical protein
VQNGPVMGIEIQYYQMYSFNIVYLSEKVTDILGIAKGMGR